MSTNFPTSLDSFANPSSTTRLDGAGVAGLTHSEQHKKINDALSAIESFIGINGSTDPSSLAYKVANVTVAGSGGIVGPAGPQGPAGTNGSTIRGIQVFTSSGTLQSLLVLHPLK